MTDQFDIEPVLDRWFAEGPTVIADRVVLGALETVDTTEQLRVTRWLRRDHPMNQIQRLAVAAAVVIVVGGGAVYALSRSTPSTGGGATPSPTAGPSAVALYLPHMDAGVVYVTPPFRPTFTITGSDGWALIAAAGPGTAWFAKGPNEPNPPDDFTLGLIRPAQVLPVGGGDPQPAPADLIAWLQARSDLVVTQPQAITVGGMSGRMVEGTVKPAAIVNTGGNISLICSADAPCGFNFGGEFTVTPGRHFEIIVLDVRGQTVVVGMDTPEGAWTQTHHVLDELLATIKFT